ncbi:hypothetical protein HDU98_009889 [Podochytrium sp. JEL0797]|nr:hypothetical protein HDU98_009889 [Podochytrium sp. JEL0797]
MQAIAQANAHALQAFLTTPLDQLIHKDNDGTPRPAAFAGHLPALLAAAAKVRNFSNYGDFAATFDATPFKGKRDFDLHLNSRCIDGVLSGMEIIHVSSGSGGIPTFWGRNLSEELAVAVRFEQIFLDAFEADRVSTLVVVALPMGSYLAQKGYKISIISPGNNIPEILRVITALSPSFQQTVIAGYPPFVKSVIDQGLSLNLPWPSFHIKCIFAGEVFSEEWRHLVAQRAGIQEPLKSIVSIYGTADCGVLGNETVLSATIRSFLASRPELMAKLFGKQRIPSFMQYDPLSRFFETHPEDGTLVVTTMPPADWRMSMPLVRYCIGDSGGVIGFDALMQFLKHEAEFDALNAVGSDSVVRRLPFVWVFGRAFWTVSMYGANVFVENVMVGLEQPSVHNLVTGKFVLSVSDNVDDVRLLVRVELAKGVSGNGDVELRVAESIKHELRRLNSEFKNYVPEEKQVPIVELYEFGDGKWFPIGVKHSYI